MYIDVTSSEFMPPEAVQSPYDYARSIYLDGRDYNPQTRQAVVERAKSVEHGIASNELFAEISTLSDELQGKLAEPGFYEALIQEQEKVLGGQELKISRMRSFVQEMASATNVLIAAVEANYKTADGGIKPEQQTQLTEFRKEYNRLLAMIAQAITNQDRKASAVALGDHGWLHLTQDYRDALSVAKGRGLIESDDSVEAAQARLKLGITAAFHDIGYATSEVHDPQKETPNNYSVDKGHPLLSFLFYEKHLRGVLSSLLPEEAVNNIGMMILNHENPDKERSAHAGKDLELSRAFAQADSSVAFGIDKLPAIFTHIPESFSYALALNHYDAQQKKVEEPLLKVEKLTDVGEKTALAQIIVREDTLLNDLKSLLDKKKAVALAAVNYRCPGFSSEYSNALDHIGPKTMGFIYGRLCAEADTLSVNPGQPDLAREKYVKRDVIVTLSTAFAAELEDSGYIPNAREFSASQIVKLFNELAVAGLSEGQKTELIQALSHKKLDDLERAVDNISYSDAQEEAMLLQGDSQLRTVRALFSENRTDDYLEVFHGDGVTTLRNRREGVIVKIKHTEYASGTEAIKYGEAVRTQLKSVTEELDNIYLVAHKK